jgi:pyruvate kinase
VLHRGPRYTTVLSGDDRKGASPREHAVASATIEAVKGLGAPAIIVITRSGFSARLVSSYRPAVPIFAVTTNAVTYSQLAAVWGVQPLLAREQEVSYEALTQFGLRTVVEMGIGMPGQAVVVTAGVPFHQSRSTNTLRIEEL